MKNEEKYVRVLGKNDTGLIPHGHKIKVKDHGRY